MHDDNVCVIIGQPPPPQIPNQLVEILIQFLIRYYDKNGHTPVRDFLEGLPPKAAAKCLTYIDLLAERGFSLPRNYIAKVRGDIWELRPEYGNVEYRFLFAWIQGQFLIAHAFVKKGRALSPRDIAIAQERIREVKTYHERPRNDTP